MAPNKPMKDVFEPSMGAKTTARQPVTPTQRDGPKTRI